MSSFRLRLLVPVGVAGAIALGAWVPTLTSAGAATPSLPSISAQQLLAKVQSARVPGLSGTVELNAALGLPDISGLTGSGGQAVADGGFDPTSLLSGSHDFSVWGSGPTDQRVALPGTLSEDDLVRNAQGVWWFDSSTQKVTHYVDDSSSASTGTGSSDQVPLTPQQAAQQFLAKITPSTTVTVASPVYVAGRPSYELVLAPKTATSTVRDVSIAVDAATGVPLQVQVTAVGATSPALSLGFTSVDFSVPAASNFAAPVGTSTVTKTVGGPGQGTTGREPSVSGSDWGSILTFTTSGLGKHAQTLDQASTPVSGAFGTGRLVSTHLVNALVLPDGRVLVGFVTPAALEAAAASAG